MSSATAAVLENNELEQGIMTLSEQAIALTIKNNTNYVQAGELLLLHKDMQKRIESYFKPLKDAAHKSWKGICNAENTELDKLKPVETYLKGEIGRYQAEQEAIRRVEEERLRQEALKAEEERRLAEALQAEAEGDKEAAEDILNEQVFVPPPVVQKSTPKVAGIATRTVWKFRIVDETLIPRQYLLVNETAIRQVVTAMKDKARIPGIMVYPEQSIAAGR